MMKRFLLTTWMLIATASLLTAQQRDLPTMKSAARRALAERQFPDAVKGEPAEVRRLDHCSLLGYGDRGFAVVTADGRQVLGVSTAPRSRVGENPAFEWWLRATDEALAQRQAGRHVPDYNSRRPNPKHVPIAVAPLLKTHWGQQDPYNRLCPYDSVKEERTAVGCVATSMAQVLNYYQRPDHGEGQRTSYYPYQDSISGQPVSVDFSNVRFRWDLLDVANFKTDPFTDEQAEAISTLLVHMSVAADMRFGTSDVNGSATTAAAAAEGLRSYLFFPEAQVLYRDSYDDAVWTDMVFREISRGNPLIYGGQAFSGGHSFVLNGYDRDGLVYVNWGWNGDDEGYFNINLLNPGGTSFAERQDMIVGLNPVELCDCAVHIELTEAGTLGERLAEVEIPLGTQFAVSGPMNAADFAALRTKLIETGVDNADLSQAVFDELPERALYGCHQLVSLTLPAGLKHIGDGALGDLRFLSSVNIEPADDADFTVDGDIIYNKDKSEIICVLTTAEGRLVVDPQVVRIHPYAFSGCVLLTDVELPASVTALGAETFRNCYWLESLKVRSKTVVTLSGYDIFDGIDKSACTLYVPSALKSTYSRRAQWKEFLSIEEFGTTVKANNAMRRQGEPNPDFGYSITGDAITGTPYLYTDATPDSPAGVYTIYVEPGTITAPDVEYVNGRLIVEANTEGIDDVEAASVADGSTYDLQGRRAVSRHAKGVSIARRADGKVVKRIK